VFADLFARLSSSDWSGGVVGVIFAFMQVWNEFVFAVVLSGSSVCPVTVGMYAFLQFN
jgi:ABC-type glycerol-3-phosphate transport system permease component